MENNQLTIINTIKDTQVQRTLEAIEKFQSVIKSQFKENHHYGIIPGTGKKPTLLKPGAEVIITLLGLSTEFEILNCTRDFESEFFDYLIKCTLKKEGTLIAEGLGSANTKETKFAREEGKGAGMDNNFLKMAKKRAIVDAALQVGSLSDVFTQDFDDLPQKDITGKDAVKNSVENAMEQSITQAQAKRIFALANGKLDIVKKIINEFGYSQSMDVKKKDYDAICTKVEEESKKEQ